MRRGPVARPWRTLFLILAVGVVIGYFSARPPEKDEPVSIVPLLSSIQQLGQLHTVRYNMHDIVEHERKLEPTGIFRSLPGAAELYGAVTSNKVLVKAEGGVEAGVDLAQVGPQNVSQVRTAEGVKYRVRLPQPVLFTPDVRLSVVRKDEGLLWRDQNLVPEATRKVQERFTEAAQHSDILQAAQTNAISTLSKMASLTSGAGATGNSSVEFYF